MTAGDKPEEGGDDVKSSCLMTWATRATMDGTKSARPRGGANLIKPFSVRIVGATRLHEAGIASNRGSACRGEYVPGLVHTARHTTSL